MTTLFTRILDGSTRAGLIDAVNGVLWNYVLIALLLGVGLWFTLRFRMIQLKALLLSVKLVGSKGEPGSISSFQAFATGLASRVGTGNIAGVAVALTVGGPVRSSGCG